MLSRNTSRRRLPAFAVAVVAVVLSGCSGGSSRPAGADPTALPTPSSPGRSAPVDTVRNPQHVLAAATAELRRNPRLLLRTDIAFGSYFEEHAQLRWESARRMYDGSLEFFGKKPRPSLEVFHRPGSTLLRAQQGADTCWWHATVEGSGSYTAPEPPQLAVLTGAHASRGTPTLLAGSVAAGPLLRLFEPDSALRRDHLLPPAGARVAGHFVLQDGLVTEFRTTVTRAFASAGARTRNVNGPDQWSVTFSTLQGARIAVPPADHVVDVTDVDPARPGAVDACNARIR